MIKKILEICGLYTTEKSSDFSTFFNESSSRERKKVIKDIVTAANNDQKALIEKYEKIRKSPNRA